MGVGRKTSFLALYALFIHFSAFLRLGLFVLAVALGLSIFFDGAVWPFVSLGDALGLVSGLSFIGGGLLSFLSHPTYVGALFDLSAAPFFLNPAADVDVSTATDADDLVVFVADIFEFAEHEQALVTDALTDVACGATAALASASSFALSVRALKR